MKKKFKETDLYKPVKFYLEKRGYSVNAEVHDCDIVAQKGGEIVIVELKKSFSLTLVYQALERQKLSDAVYVSFAAPEDRDYPKNIKKIMHLLRRLELGLIIIHFSKSKTRVEILFHPSPFQRKKNHKRKRAVIREASGRVLELNQGGSTSHDKKVTLYRQQSIQVAVFIALSKKNSAAALVKIGCPKKTSSILQMNYYGWFERLERGVYRLHKAGRAALKSYPELVTYYKSEYKENTQPLTKDIKSK